MDFVKDKIERYPLPFMLGLLLFSILCSFAIAAVGQDITLHWNAVTTDTNGNPISGVTYEVWGSNQGQPPQMLVTGLTSLSNVRANVDKGVVKCYFVYAIANGMKSDPTPTICDEVLSKPSLTSVQ